MADFFEFFPSKISSLLFSEQKLTNPTSEKNVVFESYAKMLSISCITGYFNQLYMKKKLLDQLDCRYRFKNRKRWFVKDGLKQLYVKNEWSISLVFWILIKMQGSLILIENILRYCHKY